MNRISKGLKLLFNDPLLLTRMLLAYGRIRFEGIPCGEIVKKINGVYFEFHFDRGPRQLKQMYFGAYEPLTLRAMKKILKEGDTFIDVGASVGFLSCFGASRVGKRGQVHSFEPNPRDFEYLARVASRNPEYQLICHQLALGEQEETADLYVSGISWLGWNTLVPNFMREPQQKERLEVPVRRLDRYLEERKNTLGPVSLIKIDTEGFEYFVLKGLENFFEASDSNRPAILCEITPRASLLMGIRLEDLSNYMGRYGYQAVSLVDLKTKLDIADLETQTDILFLPGGGRVLKSP